MPVEEPRTTSYGFALDPCIVAPTVDDVLHLVLDPDERVAMFCYAQRVMTNGDVHSTTIVLGESHLLVIRPTVGGRFALDIDEDLRRCSLVASRRRTDGSLLIAIHTPSGLLQLHVDASWMAQADLLEATFTVTSHHSSDPTGRDRDGDGITRDGDRLGVLQVLSGLATDHPTDDIWFEPSYNHWLDEAS